MTHLAFDPANIGGTTVYDARTFFLQRADARRFRRCSVAVIKRNAVVSERCSSSGEAAFMCRKIAARQ